MPSNCTAICQPLWSLQALPTTHTLEGAHMFVDLLRLMMLVESPRTYMHGRRWVHPLCTLWTTQHMLGFDNKMRDYVNTFAHPNEKHESEAHRFCNQDEYFKVSWVKLIDGLMWFLKDTYISYLDTYVPRTMLESIIVHTRCTHLSSRGVYIHSCWISLYFGVFHIDVSNIPILIVETIRPTYRLQYTI